MTDARYIFLLVAALLIAAAIGGVLASRDVPITEAGSKLYPKVIDGDSLAIGRERVRLAGIDAPELYQHCYDTNRASYPCGARAKVYLRNLIKGKPVTCQPFNPDRYGRSIAVCSVGGKDIGAELVRAGWATDSDGHYLLAEFEARQAKRGIWAGEFQDPAEWRAEHPRKPAQ
jgi:endonuclease YncB( thermonuclease family)